MSIYEKLLAIQADMGPVAKKGFNKFHNYPYIRESDILDMINPLCAKHKVSHYVTVVDCQVDENYAFVKVQLVLTDHEASPEITADEIRITAVGSDTDKNGKAIYKAQTGA